MNKTLKACSNLFILFICLETIFYFLNVDKYLQFSGFNILIIISLIFGTFASLKRCMIVSKEKVAILVFLLSILLSSLINLGNIERGYILSYIIFGIFSFLIFSIKLNDKQIKIIISSYILLAVIISLLILLFRVRYYELNDTRLTIKIGQGPLIDPNYLGCTLVAPLFFSISNFFEKEKKFKYLYLIEFIIILAGIFLTGSRGSILAVVIGMIIVIFKITILNNNASLFLKIFALVLSLIVLIICIIPINTLQRLFAFSSWIDSSNIRRIQLWENALEAIKEKLLIGYGIASTETTIGAAAHNTYLEVWLQLGILGITSLLYLIIRPLFTKNNIFVKSITISTFIFSIFISAEMLFTFWLNIILCLLITQNLKEEKLCEFGKCNCSDL